MTGFLLPLGESYKELTMYRIHWRTISFQDID